MHTRQLQKLLLVALVTVNCTACGLMRDRRDAPWDPKPGQALHQQLPNWEHPYGKEPNYRPDGF